MRGSELRSALSILRWSGKHLAKRIKCSDVTVSRWLNDVRPVPGSVEAYVELMIKIKEAGE